MDLISLSIDGQQVQAPKGATILEAAKIAGINIPTLCYLADLSPEGSCRVCVVEVAGTKSPVTACTYPVSPGMSFSTNSVQVREARQ